MKRIIPYLLILSMLLAGCYTSKPIDDERLITPAPTTTPVPAPVSTPEQSAETYILFTRHGITVNGEEAGSDSSQGVYAANDIIYYEADHDFTYGEGTAEDEHTAEEAAAHTVIHITQPGTYRLSGTLPAGQVSVDLGEDAKDDPNAVVTLILDGVGIECTVAPAIIFYNVYECGDADNPTMDVDTSAAGANVIIADDSVNTVNGSHVARIYESVTLSDNGKEIVDSQTLHKYDGAVYSCMSMNISAEKGKGESTLSIQGDNEGLGSEMHLTINSGTVSISAAHSGLDAGSGVYINGGTVTTMDNSLSPIEGSQTYAVFSFAQQQRDFGGSCTLKNAAGEVVFETYLPVPNSFSNMLISSPALIPGTYTLWCDDTQLGGLVGGFFDSVPKEDFEGEFTPPEDFYVQHIYPVPGNVEGDPPPDDGFNRVPPEHSDGLSGFTPPEGFEDGIALPDDGFISPESLVGDFDIKEGANFFTAVDILPVG